MMYYIYPTDKDLQHHGVLGMKWGIRRYQNKDGSLTARGKRRLGIGNNRGLSGSRHKVINSNTKILSAKGPKTSPYRAMREVNARYKDTNNCSLCTFAMDARMKGYNVRAFSSPGNDGRYNSEIEGWYLTVHGTMQNVDDLFNAYNTNTNTVDFNKYNPHEGNEYIKNELLKMGDGSYGHLCMTYADSWDGSILGGHDTFFMVENGQIAIYEGQSGRKYDYDEYMTRFEQRGIYICGESFLRTDNLEINEQYLDEDSRYFLRLKPVAEDDNVADYNYTPAYKKSLTKTINYTPPYKSKSELELFKEDVKNLIDKAKKKLKDIFL